MAFNQSGLLKISKVLGYNRLRQLENRLDVCDRKRLKSDQMCDTKPVGITKSTMHADDLRQVVFRSCHITVME